MDALSPSRLPCLSSLPLPHGFFTLLSRTAGIDYRFSFFPSFSKLSLLSDELLRITALETVILCNSLFRFRLLCLVLGPLGVSQALFQFYRRPTTATGHIHDRSPRPADHEPSRETQPDQTCSRGPSGCQGLGCWFPPFYITSLVSHPALCVIVQGHIHIFFPRGIQYSITTEPYPQCLE
jgi:hypothetical protein